MSFRFSEKEKCNSTAENQLCLFFPIIFHSLPTKKALNNGNIIEGIRKMVTENILHMMKATCTWFRNHSEWFCIQRIWLGLIKWLKKCTLVYHDHYNSLGVVQMLFFQHVQLGFYRSTKISKRLAFWARIGAFSIRMYMFCDTNTNTCIQSDRNSSTIEWQKIDSMCVYLCERNTLLGFLSERRMHNI